ncbi:MAG: hypothetical protein GX992_03490 [Clostridium sp.]|nr:hypothetical protein [Clostridium sp.]
MNKHKKLETITNGLNAASEIIKLQDSTTNQRNHNSITPEFVSQALQIIARYSPEKHRAPLTEGLNKTNLYSDVIKKLKLKMLDAKKKDKIHRDDIVSTLHILRQIAEPKQQTIIDKILKIRDILDS